jgi:TIR domain/Pentapeptide repeats (9 copies)
MANPEHLRILKQGVEVWNRWREEVPNTHPDLTNTGLKNMNLCGVNFSFTHLLGSTLSGANLTSSYLNVVSFRSANLTDANLANAFISDTDFTEAELRGADFSNATLGFSTFCDNDLSEVKGLESVTNRAPSFFDIDTIYRSKGNLPEVFLRKAGVPNSLITFVKSLDGKAIDFYSCFISFTEADDVFSEQLYNDLQAAGVRCWRWKEDAKWGRTLMRSIDEAVRVYNKLIVICSEASLNSPAVIREIERALQKEDDLARRGEDSEVLCPIRLDDYIFTGWNHHRKADVLAKNVGDFRQWKEPELYRKGLHRLIRDLKAGESK